MTRRYGGNASLVEHPPAKGRAFPDMNRAQCTNLNDFMGWRCESCDQLITKVDDGWVEWLASEDDRGQAVVGGLRLVHRRAQSAHELERSCRYDASKEFGINRSIVEGLSLARLVGPDGLMTLLSLLAAGELPKGQIIELTKRLHIPGYELSSNLSGITSQIDPTAYLGERFYLQSELEEQIVRAIEHRTGLRTGFRSF